MVQLQLWYNYNMTQSQANYCKYNFWMAVRVRWLISKTVLLANGNKTLMDFFFSVSQALVWLSLNWKKMFGTNKNWNISKHHSLSSFSCFSPTHLSALAKLNWWEEERGLEHRSWSCALVSLGKCLRFVHWQEHFSQLAWFINKITCFFFFFFAVFQVAQETLDQHWPGCVWDIAA